MKRAGQRAHDDSDGTFALLPSLDETVQALVAVVRIPFDGGSPHQWGARFGPKAVRRASQTLRPSLPMIDPPASARQRVADAGEVIINSSDVEAAVAELTGRLRSLFHRYRRLVAIGGDHTITLPMLRAAHERHGPMAIAHFDPRLDTQTSDLDTLYSHNTWLRRATEEGLLVPNRSVHVGLRGSLESQEDLKSDRELGFLRIHAREVEEQGTSSVARLIRERASNVPLYLSVDINVLDQAFAPGACNPEPGGLSSPKLLAILSHLGGSVIASADVVEVCADYDHSEVTALVADIVHELLNLLAVA